MFKKKKKEKKPQTPDSKSEKRSSIFNIFSKNKKPKGNDWTHTQSGKLVAVNASPALKKKVAIRERRRASRGGRPGGKAGGRRNTRRTTIEGFATCCAEAGMIGCLQFLSTSQQDNLFLAECSKVISQVLSDAIVRSNAQALNMTLPCRADIQIADAVKYFIKTQNPPVIPEDSKKKILQIVGGPLPDTEKVNQLRSSLGAANISDDNATFLYSLLSLLFDIQNVHHNVRELAYTMGPLLVQFELGPGAGIMDMMLLKHIPKSVELLVLHCHAIFADTNAQDKHKNPDYAPPDVPVAPRKSRHLLASVPSPTPPPRGNYKAKSAKPVKPAGASSSSVSQLLHSALTGLKDSPATSGCTDVNTAIAHIQKALTFFKRVVTCEPECPMLGKDDCNKLWLKSFSYLQAKDLGRSTMVCHLWSDMHETKEASSLWCAAASQTAMHEFEWMDEEAVKEALDLATKEQTLKARSNPFKEIVERLTCCTYWLYPEDEDNYLCSHLIMDLTGEHNMWVGAAMSDGVPVEVQAPTAWSMMGGPKSFVPFIRERMQVALNKLLGSHTFFNGQGSLLLIEGKDPIWKQHRSELVEMIFSEFEPIGLCVRNCSFCAFLVSGSRDGVVVDSGDFFTRVMPIYDLRPQIHASSLIPMGAASVSTVLNRTLTEKGTFLNPRELAQVFTDGCYVSPTPDITAHAQKAKDKKVTLPSGAVVTLKEESYRAPEIMFTPSLAGRHTPGITHVVSSAVDRCPMDTRIPMLKNIFLTGRNCSLTGFRERLLSTLKRNINAKQQKEVKVEKHETDLRMQAYHGASLLTEDQYEGMEGFVQRSQYDTDKRAAMAALFHD